MIVCCLICYIATLILLLIKQGRSAQYDGQVHVHYHTYLASCNAITYPHSGL